MRLRIPTILVAVSLLVPGANGALTSMLVTDSAVGGGVSLADGATASRGTLRAAAYGNNAGGLSMLADPLPGGSVLAADTSLITMSPFAVVTPGGFVSPSGDVFTLIIKPILQHDATGRTSYAAGVTIPEPASLALLGAALLGFTKLLRKKLGRS